MSDKIYVGSNVASLEKKGEFAPISRVTMWYDDEHYYTAGDDSGRTLECENPWATQKMVDNVYKQLKGFVYRPFEATGVPLDMAAELGDAVTIGGVYSMIGSMTRHYDAACLADISAPGEKEIDHEYPYKNPQDRELKRRVKLEQKYYGAKISRREGLVIEKTDGETVSAKAVLNADELSFYDAGGGRVLYFDPTSGTYKFLGELNVNDKFVVDRQGNVTLAGNINMSNGSITWGGNGPVQYKFAPAMTGPWHDTMEENDKYRRDSLDGGTTWGDPYQFKGEDGKDGANGANGSDATIPKYITDTIISKGVIEAPRINANTFGVYPSSETDYGGSFNIFGQHLSAQYHMFQIAYQGQRGVSVPPRVEICSPESAEVYFRASAANSSGSLHIGALYDTSTDYHTTYLHNKVSLADAQIIDWGDNHPVAVLG